jgi:predicted dehydrogenase
MKFSVLGAKGRMGSLHTRHLRALGHEVQEVDFGLNNDALFIPDGIVSATPAAHHIVDIKIAIDQGIPIFVEKPICLISQVHECRKLLERAQERGVLIHVGYNLRFHPEVIKLKIAIIEGNFEPMFGAFVLRQRPSRPIKNFLEEWASHEVDLARYLLGPAYEGTVDNSSSDELRIILNHDGKTSFVHADAYWDIPRRSFTLIDTNGCSWSRDIEFDHVTDDHYKLEIKWWSWLVENKKLQSGMIAGAEESLSVISLFKDLGL